MDYSIILGLIGGLGLFLYGMKLMSDGLEKAAGAKLRGILEFFTKNRFEIGRASCRERVFSPV